MSLRSLLAPIERALVSALDLEPRAIPPELAAMTGAWKGHPATLVARAYHGPRIRYARAVEVDGSGLEIVNFLCVPAAERPLPVLGVDLVDVGRGSALVAADLTSMGGDAQASLEGPPLPAAGELPAWAERWFSPEAVFARVEPDQLGLAGERLARMAAAFSALAQGSVPDRDGATARDARQRAYLADHREHDRGLVLLRTMFDPTLADRFLAEILFPARLP